MIVIPGFPVPIASGAGFGQIPVGGILLYEELTAPAGYEMYYASSMATRALRGVGPLTAEKAVGGVDQYTITGTTTGGGGHSGGSFWGYGNVSQSFPGTPGVTTGIGTAGSHGHSVSVAVNHIPLSVLTPLIRKVAGPGLVPPGASVLHARTNLPPGFEHVAAYIGRILRGHNAAVTTAGSAYPTSRTFNTGAGGSHMHGQQARFNSANSTFGPDVYQNGAGGGHTHSVSAETDVRLRAVKVAQCRAVTGSLVSVGTMIGYDGTGSLGAGWRECNGSNGTRDMRDHYPILAALAEAGQVHGDGQVIWTPTSISSVGGHTHQGANQGHREGHTAVHSDVQGGHGHSMATTGGVVDARWYGMRFIQYIP